MDVHPVAHAGFASGANAYARGRPGYPSAALHWLVQRLGLRPGAVIFDLAAGTGILSRALAATGARVIAVEPVAEMRRLVGPGIEAVEGKAEAIPLADRSADVVTVGQAFHWFDGDAALAEIHRVLRPEGFLGLLWNVRRMQDPIHAAIEDLIASHCESVPRHGTGAWRQALARTALFGPLEEVGFAHEQLLDREALAARVASTSAIAALPESERARVLEGVRALAEEGPVTLRYTCEVQVAQRR